jgi:hypothetical protein
MQVDGDAVDHEVHGLEGSRSDRCRNRRAQTVGGLQLGYDIRDPVPRLGLEEQVDVAARPLADAVEPALLGGNTFGRRRMYPPPRQPLLHVEEDLPQALMVTPHRKIGGSEQPGRFWRQSDHTLCHARPQEAMHAVFDGGAD